MLEWVAISFSSNAEDQVQSLGHKDPLEKEMATHSSTLAWKIPWTEEPGGLQPLGTKTDTTERLTLELLLFTFNKE